VITLENANAMNTDSMITAAEVTIPAVRSIESAKMTEYIAVKQVLHTPWRLARDPRVTRRGVREPLEGARD